MALPTSGIRLFRLFGIQVYLHWTWLVIAVIEVQVRSGTYSNIAWNIAEYITLFAIVLMHEFGHALACRSVGGRADRIMLWPLGGVAFVAPPQRPGAVLWSIAAGPLVNVILVPVTLGLSLAVVAFAQGSADSALVEDIRRFTSTILFINILLLVFNILPIYPLDGGQILRALLWYFTGPARSLMIAASIGLAGSVIAIALVLLFSPGDIWLVVMALFVGMQSWNGLRSAQAMRALTEAPRHAEVRCPACGISPPVAPLWRCACGRSFDPFASNGVCPTCARQHQVTACPHCGQPSPIASWTPAHLSDTPPHPAYPD
jgi:Zn-dependent protease